MPVRSRFGKKRIERNYSTNSENYRLNRAKVNRNKEILPIKIRRNDAFGIIPIAESPRVAKGVILNFQIWSLLTDGLPHPKLGTLGRRVSRLTRPPVLRQARDRAQKTKR